MRRRVWITSKRYFLRRGAADNGIKVYSNAPKVTLTLNGKTVSTLDNGQYVIPNGPYLAHAEKKKKKKGEPDDTAAPAAALCAGENRQRVLLAGDA